jgi:hypothetical protein
MDLSHMIHRQGEERLRSLHAASADARALHRQLADLFRDRIDVRRRVLRSAAGLGASAPPRL